MRKIESKNKVKRNAFNKSVLKLIVQYPNTYFTFLGSLGQWENELITQENHADCQHQDYIQFTTGKFQGMCEEMLKHQGKHKLYLTIKSLQMDFSVVLPKSQVKWVEKYNDDRSKAPR
jgi:hypothetical protein